MVYETVFIDINKVASNTGQIEGVPANPRIIRDEKYKKLKASIEEDPEMLSLRELIVFLVSGVYVCVCGNMRFVICKELGFKEMPCKILPHETPAQKIKAYSIKDNNSFGEYDLDALEKGFEINDLLKWGVELDIPKDIEENEFEKRFNKINDSNCVYPIVPEYDEDHEAFIIISHSEVDSNWLRERLGMNKMKSYKAGKISKSNVISIEDIKNVL